MSKKNIDALRERSEKYIEQYVLSMQQGNADGQAFIEIMGKLLTTDSSADKTVEINEWVSLLKTVSSK